MRGRGSQGLYNTRPHGLHACIKEGRQHRKQGTQQLDPVLEVYAGENTLDIPVPFGLAPSPKDMSQPKRGGTLLPDTQVLLRQGARTRSLRLSSACLSR